MKKHHQVVAAIIQHEDKFLCLQRGPSKYEYISYKFEFPGGKIEQGETSEEALKREILEELNLEISVGEELITVTHEYEDFKITMNCYLAKALASEFELREHVDSKWLTKEELPSLDWATADLPIVEKLLYG